MTCGNSHARSLKEPADLSAGAVFIGAQQLRVQGQKTHLFTVSAQEKAGRRQNKQQVLGLPHGGQPALFCL